jgi:hypothetical protein
MPHDQPPPFWLAGSEFSAFCPLPGQNERAENAVTLHFSALATEPGGARVALLRCPVLRQASRLYHPQHARVYEFVKVQRVWANVKESQWTFPPRKNGLFDRDSVDIFFRA